MEYDHQKNVVYGYKDGMGLILDVLTPSTKRNGAAVISLLSAGCRSNLGFDTPSRGSLDPRLIGGFQKSAQCFIDAGYVVFAVAHSSAPKYQVDEIIPDISRAVRFIRYHAERFDINSERIGIRGGSTGGMLSLMAATAPPTADIEHEDPVERISSHVQAVVAYFPPTDLLNWISYNVNWVSFTPFDFHSWCEESRRFERVVDPDELKAILHRCSPINHANANSPPSLLVHGDEDDSVPIQQSELFIVRLKEVDVAHKLIVAKGEGHGWAPTDDELNEMRDWFDRYLLADAQV